MKEIKKKKNNRSVVLVNKKTSKNNPAIASAPPQWHLPVASLRRLHVGRVRCHDLPEEVAETRSFDGDHLVQFCIKCLMFFDSRYTGCMYIRRPRPELWPGRRLGPPLVWTASAAKLAAVASQVFLFLAKLELQRPLKPLKPLKPVKPLKPFKPLKPLKHLKPFKPSNPSNPSNLQTPRQVPNRL